MPSVAHALPLLLHDGDRLTRDEFLRRWDAMPELKRAELIDGIVYMPSPVSIHHSDFHSLLDGWLGRYAEYTEGCKVLKSWRRYKDLDAVVTAGRRQD